MFCTTKVLWVICILLRVNFWELLQAIQLTSTYVPVRRFVTTVTRAKDEEYRLDYFNESNVGLSFLTLQDGIVFKKKPKFSSGETSLSSRNKSLGTIQTKRKTTKSVPLIKLPVLTRHSTQGVSNFSVVPPILPYQRVGLTSASQRGFIEWNQVQHENFGLRKLFSPRCLESLVFTAGSASLGRTVVIKFQHGVANKVKTRRQENEKKLQQATLDALSRVGRKLSLSKIHTGGSLGVGDVAVLRLLASIAPVLCRLEGKVFVSDAGVCKDPEFTTSENGENEMPLPLSPSPVSSFVFEMVKEASKGSYDI